MVNDKKQGLYTYSRQVINMSKCFSFSQTHAGAGRPIIISIIKSLKNLFAGYCSSDQHENIDNHNKFEQHH